MDPQTPASVRMLALVGHLAAAAVSLTIAIQIWTGSPLPIVGSIGPSPVGAVLFFLFGSVFVDFVFKWLFFAIALPIMAADHRSNR